MEHLYKLKDALMDALYDLDTVKSGKLKMGELEALNYITDTIKNVDKICMLKEDEGYSGAGAWEAHINGDYGNSRRNDRRYDHESSYANRGKHLVRSHYSRADGKEMTMKHLEKAMESATDRKEREVIEKAMEIIENA